MPLFDYKCADCAHKQEHYFTPNSTKVLVCPECESDLYVKQVSGFLMNVEYGNIAELVENKIDPSVRDLQAKIGKETLDQDTKTLDNLYGKDKVEKTFYQSDD